MTWSPERPIEIISDTRAGDGRDQAVASVFLAEERFRLSTALKGLGDG